MTNIDNTVVKENKTTSKENMLQKDSKSASQKKFQIFLEVAQGFGTYEIDVICSLHRAVKNNGDNITISEAETRNMNRYLNLGFDNGNNVSRESVAEFRLSRACAMLNMLPNFIGVEHIGNVANFLIKFANDKKYVDEFVSCHSKADK